MEKDWQLTSDTGSGAFAPGTLEEELHGEGLEGWHSQTSRRAFDSVEMSDTRDLARVQWDGDPAGWQDYVRKARLAWERTRKRNRRHLGPELAAQLSGRAWMITQELDLMQPNGARYLLEYSPRSVPDAGSRAEELLVRLRRPHGMSMATWCSLVREAHRQLQSALKRARDAGLPTTSESLPSSSPTAGRAARGAGGLLERAQEDPEEEDDEEQEEDEAEGDLGGFGEVFPLKSAVKKSKGRGGKPGDRDHRPLPKRSPKT